MRIFTIAALAALSLNAHSIEYVPDPDVAFDIIQMHDTTTWEKVCESFNGVCDVPEGTYQVKLLDQNWNELARLRDVRVQHSSPQDPAIADLTVDICRLYTVLPQLLRPDFQTPVPDYCPEPVLSIGDTGPGGGIVFYLDGTGGGLEVAPVDQGRAPWCEISTNIAGVENLARRSTPDPNSGAANTPRIVSVCGAHSAAGLAAAYVWPNGQTDGFLPNKEELNLLQGPRDVVGGLVATYWSSSAFAVGAAWFHNFSGAPFSLDRQSFTDTENLRRVRSVRAF